MVKPGATKACDLPWPQLNSCLRGFRKGEMLTVTAGSGTGKSSVCRELAHHFLRCGLKVGMLSLEESLQRTMQGIVGIEVNKPLHLDPGAVPAERVEAAFHSLFGGGRLFLYDHFGSMDPDRMVEQIKYLADVEGVDVVFLDHLTIVVSGIADLDERRALDVVCTKLRQVVEQTGIGLVLVSHLKRPEGRGHEEGAQTSLSQLRGSHAIAQLSDCVLGCERNQQGDPAERSELQLRVLKNRFCGTTGPVDKLLYDQDSGRLTIPMSHYFGT
jgi:twinkle protein